MTFINLKHFKGKVATVAKISDRNNFVELILSKQGRLSFRILFGDGQGQVSIPIESRTIKDKSQFSDKTVVVPVEILAKLTRNLPVLLEEIKLEFTSPGLIITGGYGKTQTDEEKPLYSMQYELHHCEYLHNKREYDLTEEKVISFSTKTDVASVLTDAAKVAQKATASRLNNLFLSCKEDEILISATNGHQIIQKYIYSTATLDADIDFIVSAELGVAIGKFSFQIAHWEIYQNFVKVTLDDVIEIFAERPLMPEFPDFKKWEDKSQHVSLIVDANEIKTRLAKFSKDTWLWLYTVENRLAIECYQDDSVGISWVKNTLKTPPAIAIVNSKLLLDTLKAVKKGTSQIRLLLPKLVAENESEEFFNSGTDTRNVVYLEFDKNSYLVAGGKRRALRTPPGVSDWLIVQGWSIFPESKPVSTAAKSVVKILSDRWNGKGWERPELIECGCGTVHDESTLKPQIKKLKGHCEFCEDYRELALYRIDRRCANPTCNTRNTVTVDLPFPNPVCMNCGNGSFTTTHYFKCLECEARVTVEDCKSCLYDDAILEKDALMWQCGACESTFFADDICDKEDLQYLQELEVEDDFIFIGCPCCKRFDVELTSSQMYSCFVCGTTAHESFYIPEIEALLLPCSECSEDLSSIPSEKMNNPFVVGGVTRF